MVAPSQKELTGVSSEPAGGAFGVAKPNEVGYTFRMLPRWSWLCLFLVVVGCGPALPDATAVIPKDPTSLAKCKVAKSSASPLVTEWPASEKAHLESMLKSRAVVVKYSGCEMRILGGCRVGGSYDWVRTTLAEDTIEILDEDELYAKVPLGAVSLEAELAQSGRLAIHTTVAGQRRLSANKLPEVPNEGGCKGATHVISAISVGAFELASGGAVSAGGGINVGSAGVGAKHKSKESRVRSAGDAEACQMTTKESPDADCASPLQVFLEPLDTSGGASSPEPGSTAGTQPSPKPGAEPQRKQRWDEPAADKSNKVHFDLPEGGEDKRWILISPEGDVLCDLPCVRRVGPQSGIRIQLDADRKEDIIVIPVPHDLGYSAGRTIRATPKLAGGPRLVAPLIILGVGVGATIGGLVLVGTHADAEGKSCTEIEDDSTCTAGNALWVGGLLAATVGGIWLWAAVGGERKSSLDMTLYKDAESGAAIDLTPNGVKVSF